MGWRDYVANNLGLKEGMWSIEKGVNKEGTPTVIIVDKDEHFRQEIEYHGDLKKVCNTARLMFKEIWGIEV